MISNKIELGSYYQIDALVVSVYFRYRGLSYIHKMYIRFKTPTRIAERLAPLKYFLAALLGINHHIPPSPLDFKITNLTLK